MDQELKIDKAKCSKLLKLSTRQINNLIKSGHIKQDEEGLIEVESIISYLLDFKTGKNAKNWKEKKVEAEAKLKNLELKIKQGDYLIKADIEREVTEAGLLLKEQIKNAVLTLPDKLAGKEAKEVEIILDKALTDILKEFANALKGK